MSSWPTALAPGGRAASAGRHEAPAGADRGDAPRGERLADRLPGGESDGRWRRRLINEALRPAEATADWRDQIVKLREEAAEGAGDPIAAGLAGLSVVAGRNEEETAAAAALLLRETLETPGKTCALITPDRDLARRVSARLARWGVEADSSAGAPLSHAPAGVLFGLLARAAIDPGDPVNLLALLKHPFVRLGLSGEIRMSGLAALERHGLRGPRPRSWSDLAARPKIAADAAAVAVVGAAEQALGLLMSGDAADPPAVHARRLVLAAEALARDEAEALGGLWAGPGGEAASGLMSALIEEGERLPSATAAGFALLLDRLMATQTVRVVGAVHPRLHILGAIEARLVRADRLVLAGLEEGVWPQAAPIDPFLSRPLRAAIGLPPPERRVGLSAHDFAQAACAPEVVLLHAERREGAPSVQSRWLWRLKTPPRTRRWTGREPANSTLRARSIPATPSRKL